MTTFKKAKRGAILFSLVCVMGISTAGCKDLVSGILSGSTKSSTQTVQNDSEKALLGSWAYAHDLDTEAAAFKEDGSAVFSGKNYSYTADESFITFTENGKEAMKLRYQKDGEEKLNLYIQTTYLIQSGEQNGVIGVWKSKENWSFEFTDKGTFLEDGVLTGHYYVNEEEGTIRLAYGAELEDTSFYYKLTDEGLFVEYPWLMVKMESKS